MQLNIHTRISFFLFDGKELELRLPTLIAPPLLCTSEWMLPETILAWAMCVCRQTERPLWCCWCGRGRGGGGGVKSLAPSGSEFIAHRVQSIALIRYLQHFCEMPGMCLGAPETGWPCFSPGRPFYHIAKGQGLLVTMACRAVISAPVSGGGQWPTEGNSRPGRSRGGETGEESGRGAEGTETL